MQAKTPRTPPPTSGRTRSARTQRRTAQREEARRRAARQQHIPWSQIVGGGVTLLAVIVIALYALTRTSATATGTGVTNPKALNPAASQLAVGTKAPNFTLHGVNGGTYNLAAQRGHPVLLEFFAVWCPICQGEAPIMAQMTKTYVPKGVRVWSILANPYGRNYEDSGGSDLRLANKSDLSWFARTFDVRHPQLVDPNFHVVNEYGINAYPGLYVIGKSGRILYSTSGHEPSSTLSAQLNRALGGG